MSDAGPQPTSAGRAAMAGGMRTAGRRPRASGAGDKAGPDGGDKNNIMRFYEGQDGTGLKVGPVTVLVMSLSYMVIVVFLHIMSKFKSALSG